MHKIGRNISKNILTRIRDGVLFGDVLYGPKGQFGPVLQRDYQLVLIVSGSLDLSVDHGDDSQSVEVTAGQVVLCLPGQDLLFSFSREHSTQHQWCTAPANLLSISLREALGNKVCVCATSELLYTIIRAGLQNDLAPGSPSGAVHQALAEAAFQTFLAARDQRKKPETSGIEFVRRVQRHIHQHFAETLNLTLLAGVGGATANHLIRLFREDTGITPMEYVWRVRLSHGSAWLSDTGLSISEVAYRSGFQNPFHFSRRFKIFYGQSPRTFRLQKLRRG